MKSHLPVFFMIVAVAVAAAQSVTIGTNAYPLAFEDSSLPAANRQRLAADLTEAFAFAPSLEALIYTNAASSLFGKLKPCSQTGVYTETQLRKGLRATVVSNSVSLSVSRTLSDEHATRLARFQLSEASLAQLGVKLAQVNSGAFTNLSLQAKLDFFWPPITAPTNPAPAQIAEAEEVLFSQVRDRKLYPPSLFRLQKLEMKNGAPAPVWGWCPVTSRDGEVISGSAVPVELVNGEWRFGFMEL